MSKESVNERINFLVKHYERGNKSAFAEKMGVKSGVINDIVGGRFNKPSFDTIIKVFTAYPDVNAEWLMKGIGDAFNDKSTPPTTEPQTFSPYMPAEPGEKPNSEKPQRAQATDNLRILTVQVAPDGDENIEMVPVWAAAGYAAGGFTQPTFVQKLPSFRLPGSAYNNGTFRCFQVHGNSMQGTLQDGDWVICRFVERWAHDMLDDRVYVVVTEQDILVKRVLNQLNERGRLTLHSDNPSFDVQFMDGRDVREVWLGVARLTQDLTNVRFDVPVEFARQQALIAEVFQRLDKLEAQQPR